ncbi:MULTISPECIES: Lrp/AsnC family transcriptional regulator [Micrococcales]|jgi:Lrp/AsnC family transcriptional regulator for asnA, asnC and gidA|uniref:Lrp/AsnC family transcriptional regulator n=1 Tax=Microbacterium paraoxydans TaxID=199592 RepID=A0A1H1RA16_9MICO|nr:MULTISPECIES: Lrp/AsnC family transcriptional regulator [Micrococcales]AMG82667.1 AsnC family transcriptional regulator [Microbacterium sp. PAMC 28756]AVL98269.1 Lrp/AsnC family transcriptional regulator [Microbacterium sp. str. 'China']KYJ97293.1 AsnC family transcriptional regulator [Microbacterium sp. CH1]MCK2032855.1 Lrp/AsnC family transcriptional regulator [Microbacterium sp. KSW4-4]MCT1364587.1 Lrp/AsnC family transcriptional regulator [Microbacterium sp. p3-SID131]
MSPKTPPPALDDISKRIVELLQEDGRRPYAEIAREVGLSEAAARQRVQRLTESGLIQIVAVTDPLQLGFHRMSMIGIRVSGDPRAIAEELTAIPELAYVVVTLGTFDILVEAVCEDDDHLLDLIATRIRTIPGIIQTESLLYAGLYKDLYNWGTR